MKSPTCSKFYASMIRQKFSLPDSIIYYIAKNPKSPKVYRKMIRCCKYFYIKNPILVFRDCKIDDSRSKNGKGISLSQLKNIKIWITGDIIISSTNSKIAADRIPKIYRCDSKGLFFTGQHLTLQQFLLYFKHVQECFLERTILYSDDSSEVPIENIISNLPNLLKFRYEFDPTSKNVSADTVKKLIQIPNFVKLKYFGLKNASQKFDIDAFYDYFKKTPSLRSTMSFQNQISDNFKIKLDNMITDILLNHSHRRMPLLIEYPGENIRKLKAVTRIVEKFRLC